MGVKDYWSLMNPMDKIGNSLISISHDHHKIHEADKFYAHVKETLATLTTKRITFKTPADTYIHYQRSGVSTSADKVSINFYEGGVVDQEGTEISISNRDLNSEKVSGVELRIDDTYTNVGTKLDAFCSYLPGSEGVGQTKVGGSSSGGEEIILKPDTVYVYEIVNGSASDNTITINFSWYIDDDY